MKVHAEGRALHECNSSASMNDCRHLALLSLFACGTRRAGWTFCRHRCLILFCAHFYLFPLSTFTFTQKRQNFLQYLVVISEEF